MFESFGYGLQCSHGAPCDSDHLRHRDRSLDSADHTFSAHAPLPVADRHDAVVAANRGNRRKDCELTLAGSSGVNFEADSQDSARIRTSTGAEQEVRPFREITCVPQERMSNGNT